VTLMQRTAEPHAITSTSPSVFYTGYGGEIIPERFAGVKLWQKPFDPLELVEDIGRLCRR